MTEELTKPEVDHEKIIGDLAVDLAIKQARYEELQQIIPLLEKEKSALRLLRYGGDQGIIPNLMTKLANAKSAFETSKLPIVRVVKASSWDTVREWRFVKKTAKRIYLRSGQDDYWELDGSSRYNGSIHHEDLALILSGEIGK